MRVPELVGGEPRVVGQVEAIHRLAEITPELLRRRHVDRDVLAGGGPEAEVLGLRMPALPGGVLPGVEVLGHSVDREGTDRFHDRGLDVLACSGRGPANQGGQHAGRGRQAGHQVREDGPGQLSRSSVAEQGVQSAERLADGVVGGPLRQRAAVAEPGQRAVDQVRPQRRALLLAQADGSQLPGAQVLQQHVEAGDQRLHQRHSLGGLEVDGQAALPGVVLDEVEAAVVVAAPEVVAGARLLDLHHIGTQSAQHRGGVRQRDVAAEFQDPDACQGLVLHGHDLVPPRRVARRLMETLCKIYYFGKT